jgi:hypothetical protein
MYNLNSAGLDLADWSERVTANAKVLGSIPAFSDTVESEGWQIKNLKKFPCYKLNYVPCSGM